MDLITKHIDSSFITRKRLIQKLQLDRERKLIFIHAPAGYGKTVLLRQFAAQLKTPVIWCRLKQNDNQPEIFFQHIFQAITRHIQYKPSRIPDLDPDKTDPGVLENLLHDLMEDISKRVSPKTIIILEDFHFIRSRVINEILEAFSRDLPFNMQLIITSRSAPSLKMAKMKIESIGAELGPAELVFNQNEIDTLLTLFPKLTANPELAAWLFKKTKGWVAGIVLLIKQLDKGTPPKKAVGQFFQQKYPDLYNYFDTEVFADLPPDLQRALAKMAVVDEFTTELVEELLESDESRVFLAECSTRYCFITQEIGETHIYRYHPLFREFLLFKLSLSHSYLFQKAGRFYLQRGYYQQAIDYSVKAEDYQMAAEVLANHGMALLREGKLPLVEHWLNRLATQNLGHQPRLIFLKGTLLVYLGRYVEAQSWFDRNQSLLEDIQDDEFKLQIRIQQLKIYRYLGEYERSLAIIGLLNTKINDPFDISVADLNLEKANSLWLNGNFRKALFILDLIESEATAKQMNYFRSALCFLMGDFAKVKECYDKSYPDPLEANNWEVFSPGIFMAGVYCIRGELSKAIYFIQLELKGRKRQRIRADLWLVYFLMALVQRESGEFETALYYLEEAENMFLAESREHHFLNLIHMVQCLLNAETKNCAANGKPIEMMLDYFQEKAETWRALAYYFAGLTALKLEETHLAGARFDITLKLAQKMGMKFLVAFSSGFLAGIKRKQGENDESVRYAEQCLRLSAKEQYRQLFWSEPIFAEVIRIGLEHHIELEFIKDIQSRNGVCITKGHPNPEKQHMSAVIPGKKSRIGPEAVLVKPVMSKQSAQLQVYCFGEFEVYCGMETITPVAWRTNKAKELLAFFIHHQGRSVTRQGVLGALWPEVSPEQAATFLHTNLYFVRQILQKTGKNQRIRYMNGGYRLECKDMFCDSLFFEEYIQNYARDLSKQAIELLEEAVTLYRGDYLIHSGWDWALERREEYNREYLQMLHRIVAYYFQQKNYRTTLNYLGKILQVNPLLEEMHQMTMKVQAALGDRQAVIRQYESLRRILMEELGLEPAWETSKLFYEMIGKTR